MTKQDIITKMAEEAKISKSAATKALDAFIVNVKTALKKGDQVTLVGFGSFSTTKRAARTGRNPRTGAMLKIPATVVPKFKPGKILRDAVKK